MKKILKNIKARKVNLHFLTFIVFVGYHEFWQDGSLHAFQSLLIAFVSDIYFVRTSCAFNEFQSLFQKLKNFNCLTESCFVIGQFSGAKFKRANQRPRNCKQISVLSTKPQNERQRQNVDNRLLK